MKFIHVISILLIFKVYNGNAQKPIIDWAKCLGGSNSEELSSICYLPDGGVIVAGNTESNNFDVIGNHGMSDFFIVKLNKFGNVLWKKTLGGSSTENLFSVKLTSDGNIVVMGSTTSSDGDVGAPPFTGNTWFVKINQNGDIIWAKYYPSAINTMLPNSNGGLYVFGLINGNFSYGIINTDGELVTNTPLTLTHSNPIIYSIKKTIDNGFIIFGTTCSVCFGGYANNDYLVVKYDSNLNKQWETSFGGSNHDFGSSIIQTSNGEFLAAGTTYSTDGDITNPKGSSDCWITRLGINGEVIWKKTFGGSQQEILYEIEKISDNKYILFCSSSSSDGDVTSNYGNLDFWVAIFDDLGNILVEKNFGGGSYDADFTHSKSNKIEVISENEFYIGSSTASNNIDIQGNHGSWDYWIAKLKICKDDLSLIGNLNIDNKYEVNNSIDSKNKILTNTNVTFDAGKKILLGIGFEVQSGGVFEAYIDGCGRK